MLNFAFGFGVASVLWYLGLISTPKVKEWYAAIKARASGPTA